MREEDADRIKRLKWFNSARFGMFVHWGLYSILGRGEWAMHYERIPPEEYEKLAEKFSPKKNPAREWVKLAKRTGMKYIVLTTKHHDGYCLFHSELTDYCATKTGPRRDLVREFVDSAREEGLRIGFYYSLVDWHHPDGFRCFKNENARRRFVEYNRGQISELCSNYGKIDIMWYDYYDDINDPAPTAGFWEAEKMNKLVRSLQPDIIINDRSKLPGDFSTSEQRVNASGEGRSWEACFTMNDSWGYHRTDDNWKSAKQIISLLAQSAGRGGNFLLNVGPMKDGSVPTRAERTLEEIGEWMRKYGRTIYGSDRMDIEQKPFGKWTVKGRTAYFHVFFWPGPEIIIGGFTSRVLSVAFADTEKPIKSVQKGGQLFLTDLPKNSPGLVPVIKIKCADIPAMSGIHTV